MKLKSDIEAGMKGACYKYRELESEIDRQEEQQYWAGVRAALKWVLGDRDKGLGDFDESIHYIDASTRAAIASELAKYKL